MAQILKETIKQNIDDAALELFSENGYTGTTMAEIAARASISTGNLYRYYNSKEELFNSLITDHFVDAFIGLLTYKMKTADGIPLNDALYYAPMNIKDREVLEFFSKYRLHIVILLSRSAGTKYENFREKFLEHIIGNALKYKISGSGNTATTLPAVKLPILRVIYENLLQTIIHILSNYNTVDGIYQAYYAFLEYHYQGIGKFLE